MNPYDGAIKVVRNGNGTILRSVRKKHHVAFTDPTATKIKRAFHLMLDCHSYHSEHTVSDLMTLCVIETFEVVEVHEQDADGLLATGLGPVG